MSDKKLDHIQRESEAEMPTKWGTFRMIAYNNQPYEMPHLALMHGTFSPGDPVLVRIHSECMTGDVFGSARCDCGEQLDTALQRVALNGGVVVYLRQEGRGIGLVNKLKAYNLQDEGFNTVDANLKLGFESDSRRFDIAICILKDLGISHVRLMTNNPEKIAAFDTDEIEFVERVPLEIAPNHKNRFYLQTKRDEMGHLLTLPVNGHQL
ncbi:MAG: GTP cyclohydrolase II [Bacteroidota bacterium]